MRPVGKPLRGTLPNQVLDHEGEGGDLYQRGGGEVRREQVDRLTRTPRLRCVGDESPQALTVNAAVGVEDGDNVRWVTLQSIPRRAERKALAPPIRIVAHQHARSCS